MYMYIYLVLIYLLLNWGACQIQYWEGEGGGEKERRVREKGREVILMPAAVYLTCFDQLLHQILPSCGHQIPLYCPTSHLNEPIHL